MNVIIESNDEMNEVQQLIQEISNVNLGECQSERCEDKIENVEKEEKDDKNDKKVEVLKFFSSIFTEPLQQQISQNGRKYFKLRSEVDPLFHSSMVTVDQQFKQFNYKFTVSLRRSTRDNIEGGNVLIGAGFKDHSNKWIKYSRKYAHFQYELEYKMIDSKWQKFEFSMGKNHTWKLPSGVKSICICILINFTGGKARYHVSGAEIMQV